MGAECSQFPPTVDRSPPSSLSPYPHLQLLPLLPAGLQESEVLADGIHPLIAIENVIAFISSKLPPGAQPVIVAHNGFRYHFRVLEWCKQRALQQAAAAAAAAATQQTSTASSSASQSRTGHDAPTANSSGSSHRATRSNSHVNSSSSSSSSAQCSPPAAAGSVVAWPDGWLFQDTLFLLWALKAQTKDLDLQLDGYFTRLPKTHALSRSIKCLTCSDSH